ncbi:NADH dehydrogenase [Camelimonas fluminis]|uniref:Nitroreductase n=1 Tax=Camelimonas fluminis TaxID=1576911 RepID=A0ABV7UKY5_9HYPH|nr:nitroreductase [Camelimonas fluminis]GHE60239.1 NADH dehydrogenase [Camelimonas fluminis]
MHVSEAVRRRMSVRAFRPDPVPADIVRELLELSARAPSGGNVQPWHVHALTGAPLAELIDLANENGADPEPAYDVYPHNLWEPYRTRRFQIGEALYASIGIPREDKPGRLRQLARNGMLFGAPVGVFVFIDRKMGPPQWSDLGMYLQTLMLLATERGLDTCPQEYWARFANTIERFVNAPEDRMLFCGVALGYRDEAAPINTLDAPRAPFAEWGQMHGF